MFLCIGVYLSGCMPNSLAPIPAGQTLLQSTQQSNDQKLYTFQSGDQIRVNVFQEKDLSGTYKLNGEGAISFPLIGPVLLQDLNIYEAEALIAEKLRDGYLKHPSISIEVVAYRPFSILGAVHAPGNYDFSEGVVMADAIALAGGFTKGAEQREYETLRRTKQGWIRIFTHINDPLHPGDILYIRGRNF